MKTTSSSPLAAAAETGSSRSDPFESMVDERNSQRLRLTPRELEVLRLLCEGLPNKLIERRLNIGAGTVKCHVANILSKLGVASRLQAVVAAHRLGLLETSGEAPGGDGAAGGACERSTEPSARNGAVRYGMAS